MVLSRRGFLKSLAVLVLGGAAGVVAVRRWDAWRLEPFQRWRRQVTEPTLEIAPTGPLTVQALQVLLAATETLAGTPLMVTHYETFFRWRAENLPGYKALYEQFMTTLNGIAQRTTQTDFVNADTDMRKKILEKVFAVRDSRRSQWGNLRIGIFAKHWVLFDQFIVREIFLLFVRTNAWVVLGYESWPGTPRGLENYRQAPQG